MIPPGIGQNCADAPLGPSDTVLGVFLYAAAGLESVWNREKNSLQRAAFGLQ